MKKKQKLIIGQTDKNNSDQTYIAVCPKDWYLSVSWGTKLRAPLKPLRPSQHYCIEGFKGRLELGPNYALNWAPIMPRDARLFILLDSAAAQTQ